MLHRRIYRLRFIIEKCLYLNRSQELKTKVEKASIELKVQTRRVVSSIAIRMKTSAERQ